MTENGWPPDTNAAPFVSIPLSECVKTTIPGTPLSLWFQKGIPAVILPAFMADLNRYVESANNSSGYNDEGSWTNGNSVGTSNHLGATAFDYNWDDHPMGPKVPDPAAGWQGSDITNGQPEEPRIRKLLDYYTYKDIQMVYWGNDWSNPHDSMHFQMGYSTYEHQDICQEFIDKFIDPSTGLSRFMESITSQGPNAIDVLVAATGLTRAKAAAILPTLSQGLALAQCTNVKRIAMFIAQTREESDNYNATAEYGDGPTGDAYKGRTWIQITWQSNYSAFGAWAAARNLISDPALFVNNPASLADIKWAGIGAAWYWTVRRPQINNLCDSGDIKGVTYAINGGYNGLPVRTAYWEQALAQGDNLLVLVNRPREDESSMGALSADEQRAMYNEIMKKGPSRSFLATDGDDVETQLGFIYNIDGNVWNLMLTVGYLVDQPLAVAQVEDVANGNFPKDSYVDNMPWLQQFSQKYCAGLVEFKQKLNVLFASVAAAEPAPVGAPAKNVTPMEVLPMDPSLKEAAVNKAPARKAPAKKAPPKK